MMRVSWRHYVLRYAAYVPADAHDGRHVYELMLMMRASSFVHTVYIYLPADAHDARVLVCVMIGRLLHSSQLMLMMRVSSYISQLMLMMHGSW